MRRAFAYLLAGGLIGVVGVPSYAYFYRPDPNYLEHTIRKIRFHPLTPPTTLRAPGTIYVVGSDGQPVSALCQVDADRLKGFLHESPTETEVAQALRKASFAADAQLEKDLKARVKGDFVESVAFSLEEVSVLEVSIANLRTLAGELQKDDDCADSIEAYLRAGEYVCQGQQVLRATAKYSIQTKREGEGSASARELRDAVRATIDPKASVDGSTVRAGTGLFYGIRLAPRCMALPGSPLKRAPVTWYDRALNLVSL